ncbi:MAG: hypothetical protein J6L82_00645 [Alphaproteobacteria bacterium]|nr:hypothetical protein [Alphaproteobacteria bacterium]
MFAVSAPFKLISPPVKSAAAMPFAFSNLLFPLTLMIAASEMRIVPSDE